MTSPIVAWLQPGDEVRFNDEIGTVIVVVDRHPLFPSLSLVIWWLDSRRDWSFDALDPRQVLPGHLEPGDGHERMQRLRRILTPGTSDGKPPLR